MAYCYDNLKLEKGMYHGAGRSFTQVLESRDPSEQYRGTALEGLDAFQRQLKRFDIKVKGDGQRRGGKVLPHCRLRRAVPGVYRPRRCARVWRRRTCCPSITAAVTRFDGMDYRSITSEAGRRGERAAPSRRGDRDPQHHGQGAGESGEAEQAGPDAGGQL